MSYKFRGAALLIAAFSAAPWAMGQTQEPWTHYGLRPLGMGNAYVSVADDFNALYYNPAGLARIKSWDGELLNPMFIFSAESLNLLNDTQDLDGSDVEDTIDLIEKNTGENHYLSSGLSHHLIFPNFGLGISSRSEISMIFHRDISVDFRFKVDLIVPISFAKSFFDESLSIGVTAKARMTAVEVDQEFSMEEIESLNDSDQLEQMVSSGYGGGADIGMLFTPTKLMEPTIGLSITDIGSTKLTKAKFYGDSDISAPPIILPSVNVGLSLKPYQADRKYVLVAMDMHSINQPYSFSNKLNFGTEFGWGQFLKVQAGLYKGWLTAGLQLDAGIVNLRLLSYAEELGETAGTKESRRYAFQIKLLL